MEEEGEGGRGDEVAVLEGRAEWVVEGKGVVVRDLEVVEGAGLGGLGEPTL